MENRHNTNDITNKQHYRCLTETDFYPPSDDRTLKSNIVDINGGDNFSDYCEYIFDLLEEEEYYD